MKKQLAQKKTVLLNPSNGESPIENTSLPIYTRMTCNPRNLSYKRPNASSLRFIQSKGKRRSIFSKPERHAKRLSRRTPNSLIHTSVQIHYDVYSRD